MGILEKAGGERKSVRRAGGGAALAVLACLAGCDGRDAQVAPLGDTVVIDELVASLDDTLGEVVRERADARVRIEGVQPAKSRGRRRAIVAPPDSRIHYRLTVPPAAILRFGTGVVRKDAQTAGVVRFVVTVDDEQVYEREARAESARRHSHWTDDEVDLARWAGREVTIALETSADEPGTAAGVPAWSRVQIVTRRRTDRQAAESGARNVMLVVIDTMRVDRLGVYGRTPSLTPTLDAWASGGLVFEQAIAQAPWTLPSMASIFTGRYPRGHGVVGRSAQWGTPAGTTAGGSWAYLSDAIPTVAAEARARGISTVGVTSNLLISRENNLARGFEHFVELPMNPMPVQWARGEAVTATFADWLRLNTGRRFFAYLHYMEPHDPYVPSDAARTAAPVGAPPEVRDGFVRQLARRVETGAGEAPASWVDYLSRLYDGEISAWDAAFGGLLDVLRELGVADRTVVIVVADHGEEFLDHGHLGHRKQLFAESVHVPLVIVGPGVTPGRRAELVELIDLFPTLTTLLDLPPRSELAGRNLLGPPPASTEPRRAFSETRYGLGASGLDVEVVSVRTAERTLVWAPGTDDSSAYDRRVDPAEHDPSEPPANDALGQALRSWRESIIEPAPPPAGIEVQIDEKLRALGYIE